MPTNAELARQLFDAFERADTEAVRALCAPGCQFSQNGAEPNSMDGLLAFSGAIARAVPDQHYDHIVTSETTDGFVEEHRFAGTLADGTAIRIPACVVATVVDGRITSLREYLDSRAATKLTAALQAPRSPWPSITGADR